MLQRKPQPTLPYISWCELPTICFTSMALSSAYSQPTLKPTAHDLSPFADSDCRPLFDQTGVYHCTDPIPAEPDWGIALRVSQEAEGNSSEGSGSGGNDDVDAAKNGKARRKALGAHATSKSGQSTGKAAVGAAVLPEKQDKDEVFTPPLLVPLQSGDAYFLLDDFK